MIPLSFFLTNTNKDSLPLLLPSNCLILHQSIAQLISKVFKKMKNIVCVDHIESILSKKSSRQYNVYLVFKLDLKWLRCKFSVKKIWDTKEKSFEMEKKWMLEKRRRRQAYWWRKGKDYLYENQIGRTNWLTTSKKICRFSEQNLTFQSLKRMVCKIQPKIQSKVPDSLSLPTISKWSWYLVHRLTSKLILMYLFLINIRYSIF